MTFPPQKRPRSGLAAALIIVAVLVVGGAGVGIYFLTRGEDPPPAGADRTGSGDPRVVTDRFAALWEQAINSDLDGFDITAFEPLVCGADYDRLRTEFERTRKSRESAGRTPSRRPESRRVDIGVKDVRTTNERGSFRLTWTERGGRPRDDETLELRRTGDEWRVCGLYKESGTSSGPPRPSTTRR